jgi:hypothetical protein
MDGLKMILQYLVVSNSVLMGPKRTLTEAEVCLLEDIHYPFNPWTMLVVPLDEKGVRQMAIGLRQRLKVEAEEMEMNSGDPVRYLEQIEKFLEPALFWARTLKHNPGLRGAAFMKDIHPAEDKDYQWVKKNLVEAKTDMVSMAVDSTVAASAEEE